MNKSINLGVPNAWLAGMAVALVGFIRIPTGFIPTEDQVLTPTEN